MSASSRITVIDRHPRGLVEQSPRPGTIVDENGGMYVTKEQLEKFGQGDSKWGRRELRAFLAQDRSGPTAQILTEYPKSVRVAGPADETNVLELLLIDLRENAVLIAPIDEERVRQVIQVGTQRRGGFVGIIDGLDKKPVAVTILHPIQWWWSQGWYFGEVVSFVHPDHRKSHHSEALMMFGQWATERQTIAMGYQFYLLCGVLGLTRFWAKVAMYRRRYMQVGAAFLYPSPNGGKRP